MKKNRRRELVQNKPAFSRIILNAYDKRITQQNMILEKFLANKAFSFYVIPTDQCFKKAQSMHCSIFENQLAKKETLDAMDKIIGGIK